MGGGCFGMGEGREGHGSGSGVGSRGGFCHILFHLPGLDILHRVFRTCTSDLTGTDLSNSIGQAGTQHRVREQMCWIQHELCIPSVPLLDRIGLPINQGQS